MLSAVLWPNDLTPLIPGAFALLVFESYLEKPTDNTLVPDAVSHKSSWQLRMESVQLTPASGPALHIKDQRQQQYILGPGQDVSLVSVSSPKHKPMSEGLYWQGRTRGQPSSARPFVATARHKHIPGFWEAR